MDEEHKAKIKASLDHVHKWPSLYMFKFIVPTVSEKFEKLSQIFPSEVDLTTKLSKNGNYTSVTIKEVMLNADEIFIRYEKVSQIEGVISL